MRVAAIFLVLLSLVSCSRDPNVVKVRYLENGNKYFEKGKYKEAAIMYRNALQKDLRYGPAHYKLALSELKLGRLPSAVGALRRAVELLPADKPEHWDAAIKLAEIYLAASKDKQYLDEVDTTAQQLLKRDPKSYDGHRLKGDLHYVRANIAFGVKQHDEFAAQIKSAVAEYRQADAAKPGQQALRMQLSRALLAEGSLAEAESVYRGVLEKDKTFQPVYTELYRLLVVQNRLAEAEQVLKSGFSNNPKQFAFLTLLAAHYYGTHRREEMVNVLTQIKGHAHDFENAYLTVGDFYQRMGESEEAVKQYREGMQADSKRKANYQKRIIEVLLRQGKRSEAAEVNEQILKDNPQDNDARGLKASFMLDRGDVAKAMAELQSVASRDPKNPVVHYHLGRAHATRSEFQQARQEFQKAIELRTDYILARLALAGLQLNSREFEGALKSVQGILEIDRNNVSARLIESAAYMGQHKYSESRELLTQMAKSNPASPDVQYQVGMVNAAEGKYKEAEEAFRKSYQLNPTSSRGLMGVVETYMAQKKPDQALALLKTESDKAPNRLDLMVELGNVAVRAGRYDLAIGQYQKVIAQLDKGARASAEIWLRLGETYRRMGDMGRSINALQEARKIMPENSQVLSTLALALEMGGRKDEARQVYEQAVKLDPSNATVLNNLAFLLAESGSDLDTALTYASRAKQLHPELYEVSDTLGWIYLKKNLSDDAIVIFKDLVAKQPEHSTFRYHLGMALSQKGDRPRALKELQEALRSNPPKDEREKIQTLIARLGLIAPAQ